MGQIEQTEHINKFSHEYPEIKVRPADVERVKKQPFEYYLVLDLEGLVEILEFPVVMINAQTLEVVDRFHRYITSNSLCNVLLPSLSCCEILITEAHSSF